MPSKNRRRKPSKALKPYRKRNKQFESALGICWTRGLSREKGRLQYPVIKTLLAALESLASSLAWRMTEEEVEKCEVVKAAIDKIFDDHGPRMWPDPDQGCPAWLADAGSDDLGGRYPRNLYYSREGDRALLRSSFRELVLLRCTTYCKNHQAWKYKEAEESDEVEGIEEVGDSDGVEESEECGTSSEYEDRDDQRDANYPNHSASKATIQKKTPQKQHDTDDMSSVSKRAALDRVGKPTRSKSSCLTCRQRKTRCSKQRPRCEHCERRNLHCAWQSSTQIATQQSRAVETPSPSQTSAEPGALEVHPSASADNDNDDHDDCPDDDAGDANTVNTTKDANKANDREDLYDGNDAKAAHDVSAANVSKAASATIIDLTSPSPPPSVPIKRSCSSDGEQLSKRARSSPSQSSKQANTAGDTPLGLAARTPSTGLPGDEAPSLILVLKLKPEALLKVSIRGGEGLPDSASRAVMPSRLSGHATASASSNAAHDRNLLEGLLGDYVNCPVGKLLLDNSHIVPEGRLGVAKFILDAYPATRSDAVLFVDTLAKSHFPSRDTMREKYGLHPQNTQEVLSGAEPSATISATHAKTLDMPTSAATSAAVRQERKGERESAGPSMRISRRDGKERAVEAEPAHSRPSISKQLVSSSRDSRRPVSKAASPVVPNGTKAKAADAGQPVEEEHDSLYESSDAGARRLNRKSGKGRQSQPQHDGTSKIRSSAPSPKLPRPALEGREQVGAQARTISAIAGDVKKFTMVSVVSNVSSNLPAATRHHPGFRNSDCLVKKKRKYHPGGFGGGGRYKALQEGREGRAADAANGARPTNIQREISGRQTISGGELPGVAMGLGSVAGPPRPASKSHPSTPRGVEHNTSDNNTLKRTEVELKSPGNEAFSSSLGGGKKLSTPGTSTYRPAKRSRPSSGNEIVKRARREFSVPSAKPHAVQTGGKGIPPAIAVATKSASDPTAVPESGSIPSPVGSGSAPALGSGILSKAQLIGDVAGLSQSDADTQPPDKQRRVRGEGDCATTKSLGEDGPSESLADQGAESSDGILKVTESKSLSNISQTPLTPLSMADLHGPMCAQYRMLLETTLMDYVDCPVAQQLAEHFTFDSRDKLERVRFILEKYPAAREDIFKFDTAFGTEEALIAARKKLKVKPASEILAYQPAMDSSVETIGPASTEQLVSPQVKVPPTPVSDCGPTPGPAELASPVKSVDPTPTHTSASEAPEIHEAAGALTVPEVTLPCSASNTGLAAIHPVNSSTMTQSPRPDTDTRVPTTYGQGDDTFNNTILERTEVEIDWCLDGEFPSFIQLEACSTAEQFFAKIDEQLPVTFQARSIKAAMIKHVNALPGAPNLSRRIVRGGEAGTAAFRSLVKRLGQLEESACPELSVTIKWE